MKLFLSVLFALLAPSVSAEDVLIIESYHSEYPWDKDYVKGIRNTLDEKHSVTTFQMDTKRLPQHQFPEMAHKALLRYQELKPDVVVLGDDNALKFMLPKLYNEPISIVFLGINSNPRKLLARYQGQAQITGILEQPLLIKNINEIGELINDKNSKILVLFDSGTTSKIAEEYISKQYQSIKNSLSVTVDIENVATLSHWKNIVRASQEKGYSAIVMGLYHTLIDKKGHHVNADDLMAWTHQHSPVPLFGFWDFSVGKGKALGGVVLFGQSQGIETGKILNQILSGKNTDHIPIRIGKQGKAIYSKEEMERWDLTPPSHWQAIDE
ncbi:ABC transporter substrate binding protein [Vibrio sp. 99-70-13A1]|uniref:ABC transporter substrate-binding protein n=1 Tax=Vibrio sp. 99-70-13A1 TaxID=2607601 RepID=UPI0014933363|nr:ABC transporter substrate binding protein [Vibrio sp. 99-70-13A1]NOH98067.1 hypothetical protein [Vibrio sp. 99-70-13A1]